MSRMLLGIVAASLLAMLLAAGTLAADQQELIPVSFLEPVAPKARQDNLPRYRRVARNEPQAVKAYKLLDNEPAGFIRELAAVLPQVLGQRELLPELYIALEKGGNYTRQGFALGENQHEQVLPAMPYLVVEPTAERMMQTVLHEGAHLLHKVSQRYRPNQRDHWTPLPHTTFAVTDRRTALDEGYAIHLEALWGHFGATEEWQAYYHRLFTRFGLEPGLWAEFYFPVRDLLTFSQSWVRYQAIRDGLPAFQGGVYPGNYLRSQLDPARDRAHLKSPGQMVASEGVVASTLFWIVAGRAAKLGARPGSGLRQPGVVRAELELLQALQAAHDQVGMETSLIDVVVYYDRLYQELSATRAFLDITRGVTCDRRLRALWTELYAAALSVDRPRVQSLTKQIDNLRRDIMARAQQDPKILHTELGPIIPVRVRGTQLRIGIYSESFPLEFDLNAADRAEVEAIPSLTHAQRTRISEEMEKGPFRSLAEFQARTGLSAAQGGLDSVVAGP